MTLSASDGVLSASLDLSVTVTNTNDGIRVRRVGTGFTGAVAIRAAPRTNDMTASTVGLPARIFIAQDSGVVSIFTPSNGATKAFLDLRTTTVPDLPPERQFAMAAGSRLLDFATTTGFVTNSATSWAVSYTSQDGSVVARKAGASSLSQMDTPDFTVPAHIANGIAAAYPAGATNHSGKLVWADDNLRVAFGDGDVPANALPDTTSYGVIVEVRVARWFIFSRGVRNPSGLFVVPGTRYDFNRSQ